MKNGLITSILIFNIFFISCNNGNRIGRNKKIIFNVLPVCLKLNLNDSILKQHFTAAFSKYKIRLVSSEECLFINEREAQKAASKVFTKDAKFSGSQDILKSMGREHRFATNMLNISLEMEPKDDSLVILKASWNNTPFPPDFSRPIIGSKKEINLTNLSYSVKENIYSIVDSILFSKELK